MSLLTNPQRAVLEQAVRDGGEIILGGTDATSPRPRPDVVERLANEGLLRFVGGWLSTRYKLTEAGRQALAPRPRVGSLRLSRELSRERRRGRGVAGTSAAAVGEALERGTDEAATTKHESAREQQPG